MQAIGVDIICTDHRLVKIYVWTTLHTSVAWSQASSLVLYLYPTTHCMREKNTRYPRVTGINSEEVKFFWSPFVYPPSLQSISSFLCYSMRYSQTVPAVRTSHAYLSLIPSAKTSNRHLKTEIEIYKWYINICLLIFVYYICLLHMFITIYINETKFVKRGLIHASDLATLKRHNFICKQDIRLRFSVLQVQ